MILRGTIEIYGMVLSATVDVKSNKKYSRPRAYKLPSGKWRAYKTINGIQKAFGSHNSREQALYAAQYELSPGKKTDSTLGVYQKNSATENGMWRVMLTIGGARVRFGEYATFGHAVLVRDVVARRAGLKTHVPDYQMPLALVSNPVARSYIRQAVPVPGADEIAEYTRRVDALNGVERKEVAAPVLTLPAELWRVQQPSRVGRSPFDTL